MDRKYFEGIFGSWKISFGLSIPMNKRKQAHIDKADGIQEQKGPKQMLACRCTENYPQQTPDACQDLQDKYWS